MFLDGKSKEPIHVCGRTLKQDSLINKLFIDSLLDFLIVAKD